MTFLTDFADQAVMLPVAVAVLLGLLAAGWGRGALAWGVAVAGVLGAMLMLKLAVMACGARLALGGDGQGLISPSGHTATAATIGGGLATLLAFRTPAGAARAAAAALLAALVVGTTRLALHQHTVPDVLVGAAVGMAGAVAMQRLAGPRPPGLRPARLLLLALVVALAFHGRRLAAEQDIRWWALDLWPFSTCRAAPPALAALP